MSFILYFFLLLTALRKKTLTELNANRNKIKLNLLRQLFYRIASSEEMEFTCAILLGTFHDTYQMMY